MRKFFCAAAAFALALGLTACSGSGEGVSVERVDLLTAASFAEDRYAGVVVSENVTKITRDDTKTIAEVYVTEGQEVSAGTKLFAYDSEAIQLELDRQKLELEKLNQEKSDNATQLKELETQLSKTTDESTKTQLNLSISQLNNEQNQLAYDIEAKNKEITQLNTALKNVTITSPVDGTIRKINESDSTAYITIQQTGAYQIKGTLNELSVQSGISVGTAVQIISRVDETVTWNGTVSTIDTESADDSTSSDSYYYSYYGSTYTSSSSYTFYVDLEDTEGLLLGQHVYIRLADGATSEDGIWIPMYYLMNINTDEETYEMTATVWVANEEDELERRDVVLGSYNESLEAYEILSGLDGSDYIADPSASGCTAGAKVIYRDSEDFTGEATETSAADAADEVDDADTIEEDTDVDTDGEDSTDLSPIPDTVPDDQDAEDGV